MFWLKRLDEKTRKELLSKQRAETPERIKRAEAYDVRSTSIEPNAILSDWCVITCKIGGNNSMYDNTIAFKNLITDLIEIAKQDSSHIVNAKLIQKSLRISLDKNDVYIDCQCDDMKYRFAYWATQGKFKWGKLQNSNGKQVRNPSNDIGAMCKHSYTLLRSNNFLNYISDKIMRTIMANLDVLVKKFNINLKEFIVNTAAYDRLLQMNLTRDDKGRFQKPKPKPEEPKEQEKPKEDEQKQEPTSVNPKGEEENDTDNEDVD